MSAPKNYSIKIRKRPWWFWVSAAVWLVLVLFFLNLGVASAGELEPQASLAGYVSALVLIVVGVIAYVARRRKATKVSA